MIKQCALSHAWFMKMMQVLMSVPVRTKSPKSNPTADWSTSQSLVVRREKSKDPNPAMPEMQVIQRHKRPCEIEREE